jgi:dihydroorotate dehydrogenase
LAPQADYVVLNISCPNTREGKTFEDAAALDALLTDIRRAQADRSDLDVPLLVKVSPPVSPKVTYDSQLEGVVDVATAHDIDGYVATNTAADRNGLSASAARLDAIGQGGLSGRPLEARALHWVRHLYRSTDGAVPIIGVGGIHDAASAYARIRAGASLLQVYTALVYGGPALVRRINRGLQDRLAHDGFASLRDAVGADA